MISQFETRGEQASVLHWEGAAWDAYHHSLHEPEPETYRELGAALYRQATHDRIEHLFRRSDEQNARIAVALQERR